MIDKQLPQDGIFQERSGAMLAALGKHVLRDDCDVEGRALNDHGIKAAGHRTVAHQSRLDSQEEDSPFACLPKAASMAPSLSLFKHATPPPMKHPLEPLTANSSPMRNSITSLRIVGALEGLSFLLLLGVAMPLKYLAGMPQAVQVVGMLHGILFILYVAAVVWAARSHRWSFGQILEALLASLYPFGPFLLDRKLREDKRWSSQSPLAAPPSPLNDASKERAG